jgi:hypothetical protein
MKKASNLSNILIGFGLSLILHFSTSTCTVAQLNEYHVEPLPKAMVPLSGTTTQIFGPSTFWKISSSIALPFQFTYLHQACSKIKVSTNGFLTFDTTETYHYLTNDLHAVDPINTLAPLWDRLGVSSSGKIHYATVGSAPNRIFVVEFYRVVWGPFSSPLVDFQIRLVEGTNDIEFHYGDMADAGFGANGASIGIKDNNGNFINAVDGSRDIPQNMIMIAPKTNFRFTTSAIPLKDLSATGITVRSTWFVSIPDTIKVIVENRGSEAQTGFIVAYQVGGDAIVREIYSSSILPGNKGTKTFSALWDPKLSGIYSVKVWTELTGDAIALNDSVMVKNAITVYGIELPVPKNVQGGINAQNNIALSWQHGSFQKPLPGEWNGKTSEDQKVHMILNFNGSAVDSCEIYYMVSGTPFPFPLETYAKVSIINNAFSFYYSDQYGRMSEDVRGTFLPPDSCIGSWRAGVYVNNVYTTFSGTWHASAVLDPPVCSGFQVFRDSKPGVQPVQTNLVSAITDPSITSCVDNSVVSGLYPAYPNPVRSVTTIAFNLRSRSVVSLKVFDLAGREVATLVSAELEAGKHSRQWAAENLPNGIYYYSLHAGPFTETKKLILLK